METVVYVALVVAGLVFTINVLLVVSKSFFGLRMSKEINVSAVASLDRIVREVRSADTVEGSLFDIDPGVLVVSHDITGGGATTTTTTTFFVEDGALKITRDGDLIGPLSTKNVTIESFILRHASSSVSDTVAVEMTITGTQGTTVKTEKFYTASVTRN